MIGLPNERPYRLPNERPGTGQEDVKRLNTEFSGFPLVPEFTSWGQTCTSTWKTTSNITEHETETFSSACTGQEMFPSGNNG